MDYTEDQQFIFDGYLERNNIFITGPGGCGKSHIIKGIVNHAKINNKKIKVCAMTGCAAVLLNCGAKTLHSWAGIGLGKGDHNEIITNILMNGYKKRNWLSTDILIVDEVSMMSKHLFELLDSIGKRVRRCDKPFGGIQVIFSGDFYQLPPVGDRGNIETSKFCFESERWENTFEYQILLDKIFRQTNTAYIDVLHQVREGNLYKTGLNLLKTRVIKDDADVCNDGRGSVNEIRPVILHPTKKHVNEINNRKMKALDTETILYKYQVEETPENLEKNKDKDGYFKPLNKAKPSKKQLEQEVKYMINNSLFEAELELKIGSQVMCIANIDMDANICNGSTGVITEFRNGIPFVKLNSGTEYLFMPHVWNSENYAISIKQIPLVLAWAITIHKSQGASLDKAQMNLGSTVFTYGQSYVALSRVRSLEGLYLTSFNPQKIKANPKVKEFYKRFYEEDNEDNEDNICETSINNELGTTTNMPDMSDFQDIEYDTEGYVF